MTLKRQNVLDWDNTFMGMAKLISMRSKDPHKQVGAVIVDKDKRILSVGYNGMPFGLSDDENIWEKEGNILNQKYTYICHAEENAVLNYRGINTYLDGATLYVTLFPCNNCAKIIAQCGIKEIVYESDKHNKEPLNIAAKRILKAAGVSYRPLKTSLEILISSNNV